MVGYIRTELARAAAAPFSRRVFLGGTAAVVSGISLQLHSGTPRLRVHDASALAERLPIDVRSASQSWDRVGIDAVGGLLSGLGVRAVRDALAPGSVQQDAAMWLWRDLGLKVVGMVSLPGDSEAHVRRRIRSAARYRDVLTRIEFATPTSVASEPVRRLHHRLEGVAARDALDLPPRMERGGADTLRAWLTDLDAAAEHPGVPTPFWPLFGDGGLARVEGDSLWPTAGLNAIRGWNALAAAHAAAAPVPPLAEISVRVTGDLRVVGWERRDGGLLVAAWVPPESSAPPGRVVLSSGKVLAWERHVPSSPQQNPGRTRGRQWTGWVGRHPVVLRIDRA